MCVLLETAIDHTIAKHFNFLGAVPHVKKVLESYTQTQTQTHKDEWLTYY